MKIYLIAGELSGDQHGADLISSLLKLDKSLELRGCGGEFMQKAGCEIAFDYREHAIMGFTEVVLKFRRIFQYIDQVYQDIIKFRPDKIIMIDYPGFNLRMAGKLQGKFHLYYYISPKVWAWNTKRVFKLRDHFEKVYCILPFELDFLTSNGVQAMYVGNPSLHQVKEYQQRHARIDGGYIALMPGSRTQEIKRMLPVMLDAVQGLGMPYKISKASNLDVDIYRPYIKNEEELETDNYELLHHAHLALVTSGTATLETALFGIPQVVCYIAEPISYMIAKRVVKVDHISLVNLIVDRPLVKELIQGASNVQNIIKELNLLQNPSIRNEILNGYQEMESRLTTLNPSELAAMDILSD